jgi:hypothetical protein
MPTRVDLPPKTRGLTAIAGAMSLIAVLLIVQIWLLSAALEAFLAGKHLSALPAAIFSGAMFLVSFGLYLFVDRVDSDVRHRDDDR